MSFKFNFSAPSSSDSKGEQEFREQGIDLIEADELELDKVGKYRRKELRPWTQLTISPVNMVLAEYFFGVGD